MKPAILATYLARIGVSLKDRFAPFAVFIEVARRRSFFIRKFTVPFWMLWASLAIPVVLYSNPCSGYFGTNLSMKTAATRRPTRNQRISARSCQVSAVTPTKPNRLSIRRRTIETEHNKAAISVSRLIDEAGAACGTLATVCRPRLDNPPPLHRSHCMTRWALYYNPHGRSVRQVCHRNNKLLLGRRECVPSVSVPRQGLASESHLNRIINDYYLVFTHGNNHTIYVVMRQVVGALRQVSQRLNALEAL